MFKLIVPPPCEKASVSFTSANEHSSFKYSLLSLAVAAAFGSLSAPSLAATVSDSIPSGDYTYQGDTHLTGNPAIDMDRDNSDPINITVEGGDLYFDSERAIHRIGKNNTITITADNVYFNNGGGINAPGDASHLVFNADTVVFNGGVGLQNTMSGHQIYDFNGALEFTGNFNETSFYGNSGGDYDPENGGGTQQLNVRDGISIHDATGEGAFVQWHFNIKTPLIEVKDSTFNPSGNQYDAVVMMMYSDVMGTVEDSLSGQIRVTNVKTSGNGHFGQAMGMYFEGGRTDLDNLTVDGFGLLDGYSSAITGIVLSTESTTNLNSLTINNIRGTGAKGTAYGLQLASDTRTGYGATTLNTKLSQITNIVSEDSQAFGAYVSGASDANNPVKIFWNTDSLAITDIIGADAGGYVATAGSSLESKDIGIARITATQGEAVAFQTEGTDTKVEGNILIDTIQGVSAASGLALSGGSFEGQNLRIFNVHSSSESGLTALINAKNDASLSFTGAVLTPNEQGSEFKYQGQYAGEANADNYTVREMAVRSLSDSEVNLNNENGTYAIVGTILAGRGTSDTSVQGGSINIGGKQVNIFGDVYAGNGGSIDIALNEGSLIDGHIDDYHELDMGLASDTVFRNSQFCDDQGKALDVTQGGSVKLALNGATWIARGQNFVKDVAFGTQGGLIDLSQSTNSSVSVANLTGNGEFTMKLGAYIEEGTIQTDMLYIQNVEEGAHYTINAVLDGVTDISQLENIRFATVKNGATSDLFTVQIKDQGFHNVKINVAQEDYQVGDSDNERFNGTDGKGDYKPGSDYVDAIFGNASEDGVSTLENEETSKNYYIDGAGSETTISDPGQAIIATARALYYNAIEIDRFNQRYGDRRYDENNKNLWARVRQDRWGTAAGVGDFKSQNTTYQIGFDYTRPSDSGKMIFGAAVDLMDGNTDYESIDGSGETKRYAVSAYATYLDDNGGYVDVVGKVGRLSNEYAVKLDSGAGVSADYMNWMAGISVEVGHQLSPDNCRWFFEPQIQAQYVFVSDNDYSNGQTEIEQDSIHSFITRAGFRAGRWFGEEKNANVYFKTDVMHEWAGDQGILVSDKTTAAGGESFNMDNKGTWFDVGLGFQAPVGKSFYAYGDAEYRFGNDLDQTWVFNFGGKYVF